MSGLFADTSAQAEELLLSLMRETPAWRKLEMVDQLNQTARSLALSGLRKRHPEASRKELQLLLAELMLGGESASTAHAHSSQRDETRGS